MSRNLLPKNVKKLRGTYRKHREVNPDPLERGIPSRPEGMSKGGKKYWKLLIDRLDKLGTITEIDDLSVMVMSESLASFMRNSKILEEQGDVYKFTNFKGEVSIKIRPEFKIANDVWTRVFQMFKQYGLTYASRGNIAPLPEKEPSNPWANLSKSEGE